MFAMNGKATDADISVAIAPDHASYTLPAPVPPAAVSVTPDSGSGFAQTFAFVFSAPSSGYSFSADCHQQ